MVEIFQLHPQDNIVSWAWDFGDGQTSTASSPVNIYADPGDYLVLLTIATDLGCTNSYSHHITVNNICCKTNKTAWFRAVDGHPYHIGGNRYMVGKLWITSVVFYRKVGAKLTCYKKNSNGNYVEEVADNMHFEVSGSVWTDECTNPVNFPMPGSAINQKTYELAQPTTPPRGIKARKNRLECLFYVSDNGEFHTGQVQLGDNWSCQE